MLRFVLLLSALTFGMSQSEAQSGPPSSSSTIAADSVFGPAAFTDANADVVRALERSAPDNGVPPSPLKHAEDFGLLGRLVGHSFYYIDGVARRIVTFNAVDHDTIQWTYGKLTYVAHRKGKDILSGWLLEYNGKRSYNKDVNLHILPDRFTFVGQNIQLTSMGDLAFADGRTRLMWAQADARSRADMAAKIVSSHTDIMREVAEVNKDIAWQCPSGVTNDDCSNLFRTRNDLLREAGEAVTDTSGEDFREAELARMRANNAAAAEQNNAMLGQLFGVVTSNLSAGQARAAERAPVIPSEPTPPPSAAGSSGISSCNNQATGAAVPAGMRGRCI